VASNYADRLRRLAFNDVHADDEMWSTPASDGLSPRDVALVRLAALTAIGGAGASFGEFTDEAVSAGASSEEIVDVLVAVRTVVGLPRVVSAAPKVGLALGYDLDGPAL
jgi:4-carboxymuconolactone decarboxylase